MAINLPFDPADLGVDVSLISDLAPVWGLASGFANLGNALARRLSCPRGGLLYDEDYGFDVTALLNAGLTPTDVSNLKAAIAAECEKDLRVSSCSADVNLNSSTQILTINLSLQTNDGPFDLVLAATAVTVSLLSVNGVVAALPLPAPLASVQVIQGPPGATGVGIPGVPGASGSASVTLDFGDEIGASTAGTEEVVFQREVNLGALLASITAELVGAIMSDSGTATFRIRIGGGDRSPDGTVITSMSTTSASFVAANNAATVSNPNGLQRVKITAQSSGAGLNAQIRDAVLTIR